MKTTLNLFVLSLLMGLAPRFALGADSGGAPVILAGKFYVSSVKGHVECVADGRIFDLKKGDIVLGRGSRIKSLPNSNATLLFSNETTFFVDEKTQFKINKFEQQPFQPNNNLVIEPSNSNTLVTVIVGRIVIGTPQLLSGTSLVFETDHAHVSILNGQPGGEKAFIEVTDKQTHFALITGAASIQVRGADGDFVSIGTRIKTGEQAYVRYTLTGQITLASSADEATNPSNAPAAGGAGAAPPASPTFSPNAPIFALPGEAVVLAVTGDAKSQASDSAGQLTLATGDRLHQGAIIITSEDAEVYLQPFNGAISDIKPNSKVVIEKLATASANGVVQKQTALLDLKKGTLVSILDPDPAKRKIDNYGVRTPRGIATAHGTSFSVSVDDNNFSVAATADSVTFVTPSGTTYAIAAGNVTITSASGQPQPPIPLSQAVAGDPAFARVIRTAVSTVSSVVQNNIGGLPSASAINLISQVVGVATAAMPAQATNFATEVVTAVNSPGASTAGNAAAATASVTSASVTAAPVQAAQIAVASTIAAPAQANTIAAAAASANPSLSVQVSTAVLRTVTRHDRRQSMAALTQTASSLAAAVAVSVPAQAGPVAGALMQEIAMANPQATSAATTQAGATLAAAVTSSVPAQAAPVASAVMQSITQSNTNQSTPAVMSQTAATLASAITSTAPSQAVPVATALMQFVTENNPAASAGASGLLAAAVSDASPGSGSAVNAAVAAASNQSTAAVAQGAQQASAQAAATTTAAAASVASGAQDSARAAPSALAVESSSAAAAADVIAAATIGGGTTQTASNTGVQQGTSILVERLGDGVVNGLSNLTAASTTASFSGNDTSSDSSGTTPTVSVTPTVPATQPNVVAVSPGGGD